MIFISRVTIALLLVNLRIRGVFAIPFSRVVELLPGEVGRIAIDEDAGQYLAFNNDGTLAGTFPMGEGSAPQPVRRAAGTCVALSVDEVENLPGWPTMIDYANNLWGDGSRNIVTNPEEYPDYAANLCVTDEVVGLEMKGEPTCQTHETTTDGALVGTSGSVAIGVDQGFTADSTFTVTKAASVGVSETVSVKVGVDAIAEVSGSFTMSARSQYNRKVRLTRAEELGSFLSRRLI
ncbi:hypothetical protein MPER_11916 [Moniliophthora perniciosa FA553]|nr:hypothetical protein MPER_11916 [Moniliophthora perniciosa FA553]